MRLFALLLVLCAPAHALTLAKQVNAMLPGTWSRITAENTAYDVDPAKDPALNPNYPKSPPWNGNSGYKAHWDAWNGGALAENLGPCGSVLTFGGGHMDYWGNQVTAINLCGGATGGIKWERLSDPYAGPVYPGVELPDGLYPNGKGPQPSHTFDTGIYIPWTQQYLSTTAQITNTLPKYAKTLALLDIATRQWVWSAPFKGNQSGTTYLDAKRKLVWLQPFNGTTNVGELASFDPDTRAVTYYGLGKTPGVATLDAMGEYDPINDRLVRMSFRSSPWVIHELDPSNPALGWRLTAQVGRPTVVHGQHSMAWSKERGAWIVWMDKLQTPEVWEVKRTSVDAAGVATYTWALLTSASNTLNPIPTVHSGGSYSKFQVVRVGCSEVLVGQLRLIDGIIAFKLPGCYGPPPPPPVEPLPPVCASAGAICEDFDGPLIGNINAGDSKTPQIENGELVLWIPSMSSANAGGNYGVTFSKVPQHSTIAFSYRIKVNPAALNIELPGRKEYILWSGPASCTGLQLSQSHKGYTRPSILWPYTQCGAKNFATTLTNPTDYIYQNGDFDCRYLAIKINNLSKCAVTVPDVWQHKYVEIQLGDYDKPNSQVQMWIKTGGGEWRQFEKHDNYTFVSGAGFDHFMLTAYMTSKKALLQHPDVFVRFDDLIIARRPFLDELRD